MGLILDDNDLGVSVELRRESFCIYTDDGRLEIELDLLIELIGILQRGADRQCARGRPNADHDARCDLKAIERSDAGRMRSALGYILAHADAPHAHLRARCSAALERK